MSYGSSTDLTGQDIPGLAALANGFHLAGNHDASGALDYVRSPILRDGWVVRAAAMRSADSNCVGTRSAAWGPRRSTSPRPVPRWFRWLRGALAVVPVDPAATATTHSTCSSRCCRAAAGSTSSVSRSHRARRAQRALNQGDPPGPHQADNGIWQDGAVLVQAADGRSRSGRSSSTPSRCTPGTTACPSEALRSPLIQRPPAAALRREAARSQRPLLLVMPMRGRRNELQAGGTAATPLRTTPRPNSSETVGRHK